MFQAAFYFTSLAFPLTCVSHPASAERGVPLLPWALFKMAQLSAAHFKGMSKSHLSGISLYFKLLFHIKDLLTLLQ